jgi:hypothetical protein
MKGREWLDYSKFQQVVAFYEKYKDNPYEFEKDFPDLVKGKHHILWTNTHNYESADERYNDFNDWLFSYCFKDGLK